MGAFALDARLSNDSVALVTLGLCDLRLMNDARFPWLLLVPRRADLVELDDLVPDDQCALWSEVQEAVRALRHAVPCDKLNIGALGNIVRQLHVHVVARVTGDAAWPGPTWGFESAQPYADEALQARLESLRRALAH